MNKSNYFHTLSEAYSAEIDDLASDFEGKPVLPVRLKEKRQEIGTMLQMIEFAPEMVAPVFYGAFSFAHPAVMMDAVQAEPDDGDFPEWESLEDSIRLSDWAKPLVQQVLAEPGGDRFMVSAAALEFLRLKDMATADTARAARLADGEDQAQEQGGDGAGQGEDQDPDGDQDLAEAGAEWMSQQGFDALSS